jgi:DNA-binding MarR family transcriptional regulator
MSLAELPQRGPHVAGGRQPLMTPAKLATARRLREAQEHTLEQIAGVIGVSRSTLVRHLAGQEPSSRLDAISS